MKNKARANTTRLQNFAAISEISCKNELEFLSNSIVERFCPFYLVSVRAGRDYMACGNKRIKME
jgi:hypothetical protein